MAGPGGGVLSRAQFQRTLFPGIRELIFSGFRRFPEEFSQIFNVLSSDKAFEEDYEIAGTGLFVRTPENVEAAIDNFTRGFPKRYQHEDFTLSVGASHQTRRDDKSGYWKQRAPEMGISARQTKEVLHAGVFENGFDSAYPGPDGKALFATDHPNPRGGTQSNILDPVGTITVLNVRIGLTQFRRFFDNTGVRRIQQKAMWLVHPPEKEYDVAEILTSAGRPDTADRADNVIKGALKGFTYDYLEDPENWFILADKSQHKLKSFNREDFGVSEYLDERTRIQWVIAAMAFSFGWSSWSGTLGANPTVES